MSPTKTANKTAYRANALHLLGPFTDLTDLTPTWTGQPAIATTTSAPRPPQNYPYGPAPLPPLPSEPLGLDSTPSYYGPGISILFLCIALAAVLQLYLPGYPFSSGPFSSWLLPSERQLVKTPNDAAPPESESLVEVKSTKVDAGDDDHDNNARSEAPQRRKNLLRHHLPLHALQIVTLFGMNLLAIDLLSKQSRLDQFSYHPVPTSNSTDDDASGSDDYNTTDMAPWIPIAASLGPPLTLLYWSVFLIIFHFLISVFRWDKTPKELERRKETEAKTAANHNLILSMLGLLFPCAVLAIMGTKTWAWLPMERTDHSPRDHFSKLYPSDFMPALYVDGIDDGLHAVFLMTAATVGAWVIVTPCFFLLMTFFDDNLGLGKFLKNKRAARMLKTGLRYFAFALIGCQTVAFAASFVLCTIGGLTMLVTWGRSGIVVMDWAGFAMMFFAWSAMSLIAPLFVLFAVVPLFVSVWTVGVVGWYGWKVLTTGGAIVGRSCLFIPCSATSVWRPDQLALAALGAGLVVYLYLLIKESPLLAAGGCAKGKKGH